MSERSWTRRDFGRAVTPALVVGPLLAIHAAPAVAGKAEPWVDGPEALPELWPEARATLHFYRKHLPGGLRFGRPTLTAWSRAEVATRSVTVRVLDGAKEVGHLDLDAAFQSGRSRPLWQGTRVAGTWYGESITNAYGAGEFA